MSGESAGWDFRDTFPEPRAEAIEAGVFGSDPPDADAVRGIHEEHEHHLLSILHDLDAIEESRRDGTDPRSGRAPRTAGGREKLKRHLEVEERRMETEYAAMIEAYESAFGDEAAAAFEARIERQHAEHSTLSEFDPHRPLPTPEPLLEAVGKGNFGIEDDRMPVLPSADEVEAITHQQGERMIELLAAQAQLKDQFERANGEDRAGLVNEKDRLLCAYQSAVALYAEDFGDEAARQLEAWAKARVDRSSHDAVDPVPAAVEPIAPAADLVEASPPLRMHHVDPARLERGHWSHEFNKDVGEGDIAAAYSADTIGMKNQIRSPFRFEGALWTCTSMSVGCEAYRLVPLEQFQGEAKTYADKTCDEQVARDDPNGFYHGMKVQRGKQCFVLQGPPAQFVALETKEMTQLDLFPS